METARELTHHLARLLRDERGLLADFLLALADFDRNKRWRELGHTSLFYFLHRELKLSKGAAQNRKTAAELIQAFPEVEAALRSGELCLSTVTELSKVLTPENREEVLPRFFGLSRREAEVVSASLRPAEVIPVREVVTSIRPAPAVPRTATAQPTFSKSAAVVHMDEPAAPVPALAVHMDEHGGATVLSPGASAPPPPREVVEPLGPELARLHVTVSARFLEKLEAAKDALGHVLPEGSAAEVLERGLDLVLAGHAKRKGLVATPREEPTTAASPERISAHVKREVWRRAGGQCEWRFDSGARCDCRRRLEFDHVQPRALGGASTIDNVRLLCRPHNQLAARREFGDAVMDRYTSNRRTAGRRSTGSDGH
jgi:hypothetical protein